MHCATLANADFTMYVFLRFFWITTLPNICRKTFSKTLNHNFSMKGKRKHLILRIARHWFYENQFRHFRLHFITFFNLAYANYWNKFRSQCVSRLYSYKKKGCNVLGEGNWSEFIWYFSKFFIEDNLTEAEFNGNSYTK